MRVLLVEDCLTTTELVSEALADLGHQVEVANSISQAEDLVRLLVFDAVILDVMVQGALTNALAKRMRGAGQASCFASGIDSDLLPSDIRDAPLLRKPYSIDGLTKALAHERQNLRLASQP